MKKERKKERKRERKKERDNYLFTNLYNYHISIYLTTMI